MEYDKSTCFFVSGHLDLTKEEFAVHYEPIIREMYEAGASFVVGDAGGCDFMTQRLLHKLQFGMNRSTNRIRIFHMLERPRHSFGSGYGSNDPNLPKETWTGRRGGFPLVGGFTSDTARDEAMTQASSDDIAWVRPVKSKTNSGTAKNLARRKEQKRLQKQVARATWPVYNVINDMTDYGERIINIKPVGCGGYGHDIPLPASLVERLRTAEDALMDAKSAVWRISEEIREECRDFLSQED